MRQRLWAAASGDRVFGASGGPGGRKGPDVGGNITRGAAKVSVRSSGQGDYGETLPAAPNATEIMGGSVWGQGIWGQAQWVESLPRLINDGWKSIGGTGYFGSLAYQVTSGSAQPLDDEIISAELTYEVADAIN